VIALIDMDSLVYRAFPGRRAGIDGDTIIATDGVGGIRPMEFTHTEDMEYIRGAWENFSRMVKDIQVFTFSDSMKGAVGGKDNFRDQLFPDYKKSRRTQAKSLQRDLVRTVTGMAVEQGIATPAHGREADDLIRIWAEECRAAGEEFIVCSIDKDLQCIPGTHCLLHNPRALVIKEVSEMQAIRHYYTQLISGDAGDDIPGVAGFGPIKSNGVISRCFNEPSMRRAVIRTYQGVYGEEWYAKLRLYGSLIHIQRTFDDVFEPMDWDETEDFL